MVTRSDLYLKSLARELISSRDECEWIEFKVNDARPEQIGEYISALANERADVSAAGT